MKLWMPLKFSRKKIEKQGGKQMKIVRSNIGCEFNEKYTENGQAPNPFAKFPQEHGIEAQYTLPDSLDQNIVAETRNQSMIKSMLRNFKLPRSPWSETLKIVVYILN